MTIGDYVDKVKRAERALESLSAKSAPTDADWDAMICLNEYIDQLRAVEV